MHMPSIVVIHREAKQLGAILVRGGGQQALGLDARPARCIEPQEVVTC